MMRKLRLALPLALAVATLDCTTKQLAVEHLAPAHTSHDVIGDVVQFTLVYNTGAAMGIPLGDNPRPILLAAAVCMTAVLLRTVWLTAPSDRASRIALGLILGGAIGNGASRLLSPQGVVDFINLGVGAHRLWIFNVADIGVFCGAILLGFVLWREEATGARAAAARA